MQSLQITFPVDYYASGKYVQIVLDVDYNNATNLVPYNSSKYGLIIERYGSIKLLFDIDEYLLVPSNFSITIADLDNNFEEILFPSSENSLELTCRLYINGLLEFEGKHVPESLSYDPQRRINIDFRSNTDILNQTMTVNSAGTQKDPALISTTSRKIKNIMHNCYKLINSSIDFVVNHNWIYYGEDYLNEVTAQSVQYTLDDLYTTSSKFYTADNIADCLKRVARRKFSFTGVVNNSKAFFTHLFYYNSSNLQTLTIKSVQRGIINESLTYVAVKNTDGSIILELPDADSYTNLAGKSLELTEDIYYNGTPIIDYYAPSGTNVGAGIIYASELGENYYHYEVAIRLHYYYRTKAIYNRLDSFVVDGLDVDYLKNFHYSGRKYQILNMEKIISEGITKIDALYLGEV